MVGTLGTESMSGVSIVNQFIFVFNLLIFGSISAAGIYVAQFYGSRDSDGLRYSFRFKFLITLIAATIGTLILLIFHEQLINLFLHDSESTGDLALTLDFGKEYLFVMLIGLIPYAVSQVYASTLRETGEVVLPMISSIVAVVSNFILNFVLIFGYLGLPALGVKGAAIATVASRFIELLVLVIYSHKNSSRFEYLKGLYSSFKIPKKLFKEIILKGIPLICNEFLFGLALTMRNQCYSTRGLDAVAALNISSTIFNLFSVVYISLGSSIAIIVGNKLGEGCIEEAKDKDRKLIAFSVIMGVILTMLMIICSLFYPHIYKTTDDVKNLASFMMITSGLTMPFCAFSNASYFTLRSGGKVLITILFDSVYMWTVVMPTAIIFAYLTRIDIILLFLICQSTDIFKTVFGAVLLKRGTWANAIVADKELKE